MEIEEGAQGRFRALILIGKLYLFVGALDGLIGEPHLKCDFPVMVVAAELLLEVREIDLLPCLLEGLMLCHRRSYLAQHGLQSVGDQAEVRIVMLHGAMTRNKCRCAQIR